MTGFLLTEESADTGRLSCLQRCMGKREANTPAFINQIDDPIPPTYSGRGVYGAANFSPLRRTLALMKWSERSLIKGHDMLDQ